jgi:hypothetical protein
MASPRTTLLSIASALVSWLVVLIALFCGLVLAPTSTGSMNPPYHLYHAFDFELWYARMAEFVGAFLLFLLLKRSGYGNRYILLGAITASIVFILFHIAMLLSALTMPPL